ncbi:outer membrane beta-barrel family protein [uncultured Algibacter sp.]|uniref:outer membrane beta-barrel protein n=1 Tax=uncultured Algibacter sp. TaxID=298659 RepID=UPI00262E0C15|nr:outer membrane beta-barrel family protein [uncultured Algibacter sp.]
MLQKLISFYLLFFCVFGYAQDSIIEGKINDQNKQPIAYVNVVIKSAVDSTFVAGTSTNEVGYFQLEGIKKGNYLLEISFIGYSKKSIDLDLSVNVNIGTIVLSEESQELAGVTVIAKRPTVKRLVDRIVFNVENSTLSNSNVLDVLKNTPGVIVNDGSISVKNSTPTVYINDRKVHLSSNEVQQLLEGTSATNLKSIEVITNPPAKYEAEGGAVLNIVTSKNIIAGYNGSVFGNYKQGSEFPKYSFGTSHFFRTKNLNTYLNYSISPRKDFRNNSEFINFIEEDQIISRWETDYRRVRDNANQNINANIDYTLDKRNAIGFSTSMLISPRENTKTQVNSETEVFGSDKLLDSIFKTDNKLRDETFNIAFTLDYLHKFKKEGETLAISGHHTNYDFSSFQNVDTNYLFPDQSPIRNNRFQTFSNQIIKIYTGQLDYELPITAKAQFEAGAKVSNISSENTLNQFTFENDMRQEDFENSDIFLYDETNYALYSSYSNDWESWSLKLGLRTEYTNIKGNSISTNQNSDTDYIKFFPSLHVLNRFNSNNEIYFNYNRRIYRPRYNQLNPFKYFLNDNAYVTGDPNLQPQIDDLFTLGYTLNKDYTFEVYFRHESNPTLQITFQDNSESLIKHINTNIDQSVSYGLDFTAYTKVVNHWNIYLLSSLFYYENKFFALESNNTLESIDRWSVFTQVNNYFSLLKDKSLGVDLSYVFSSRITDGPSVSNNTSGLDISLRKIFWNNRATLSVGVTDVFNAQNLSWTTRYLNQDVFVSSKEENRLFTLGFSYKFGNFRLNSNKKSIEFDERNRLN